MDKEKIKHLEFIQNIATRHNTNSFQLKSLMIAIISGLLALYASTQKEDFISIGIIPSIFFWFLDAYYLQQERKFRGLYNDVAGVSENPKEIKPFEMRPNEYTGGKYKYVSVLFSSTIWPLYSTIIVGMVLAYYLYAS